MATSKFILCSLVLLLGLALQAFSAVTPLPQSLIREMAKREMRYHHYLWHNIRENWNRLSSDAQKQIRALGWAPPRPGRRYDADGVSWPIPENQSGEDFLYMHRQMIAKANAILAKYNEPYGKITGWKTIPSPSSETYPVPKAYTITGNPSFTNYTNKRKTSDYYYSSIKPTEEFLKDPVNLRNMTLSQLGSKIEVAIHSWMHMRWSSSSSLGYRPSSKDVKPNFDKKWDDIRYNWLGDSYASHVHPIFWKLHGWVDDRIEDWRRAHNLSSIKWTGTWTGGPMSSFSSVIRKEEGTKSSLRGSSGMNHENHEAGGDVMEKVLEIMSKEVPEVNLSNNAQADLEVIKDMHIAKLTKPNPKSNAKRVVRKSRVLNRKN